MPLNRLPDFINSNISLTGVSADYLDGVTSNSFSSSLRANRAITGGGTITFDGSSNLFWSTRFIVISNGRGPTYSLDGYYDINCPTSGTIIGVGGAANRTATASGITLGIWEALYAVLPIGLGASSATYRVAAYFSDFEIPHDWVLIAVRNGDNGYVYLNNGVVLAPGQSNLSGFSSNMFVGASNTENFIAFRGTTGDAPGDFNHTYIGERIYGGSEQSELVLFKGNDNDLSSGPDRIRSIAAHHVFDTYTSALSGSFNAVATSGANVTRMIIREGGHVGIGTTTPHTIGTSSTPAMLGIIPNATTTVGLVVRGAASQTADLTQWQSSAGTVVASVAVDGAFRGNYFTSNTNTNPYVDISGGAFVILNRTNVANTVSAVRGMASQTGDLMQWQNSALAILGRVSSQGAILGTLIGTETNYFPYFETIMPGGNDQAWKKLITVTMPVGLYTGLSFAIDISENNGNFGNNAIVYKSRYIVSVIRSGGVQDDSNTITIVGPEGSRFLRGLKVNSSTYEIQFRQPSDWNQINVKIQGLSAQTANITYGTHYQYHSLSSGGTAATTAGTAVYSPTYGNIEKFTAITSTQVIAQALDTGTVPLVSRAVARTNLVPNPSFETNTTGWDGSFENTTIARTTAVAANGSASLSITSVAAGNMSIRYGYGTSAIPITQNTQYTFSVFVRSATVSRNMRLLLSWFNGSTFVSNSVNSPDIASSTSGWTRINITALSPAGVNYCAPYISILSTAAAGEVHYVDSAMLESGTYLGSYIDTTASQTVNLQEWQNSSATTLARVDTGGNVIANSFQSRYFVDSANSATPYFDFSSNNISVINRNVGWVNLTVKGFASQTADLQQWQNSAGTVLANILSDGSLGAKSVTVQGGGGQYVAGSIYSDTNWGMIFRAKQASPIQAEYRWATSTDAELMRISPAGNVGVATTSPSAKLTVNGSFQMGQSATATNNWHYTTEAGNGKLLLWNGNYGSGTFRYAITSAGDVGIGTDSPATRLSVIGTGTSAAMPTLGTASGVSYIAASTGTYGLLTGVQYTSGDVWMQAQRTDGSATAYNILLNPSGGRVGIGVSSASYPLHISAVTAEIRATSSTGTNHSRLVLTNTGGSFQYGIDTSTGGSYGFGAYARVIWNDGAHPLVLTTSSAERMRLTSDGSALFSPGVSLSGTNTPFKISSPSSGQGLTSGLTLFSTFTGTGDNGPRRTADIVAGYSGGAWGNEYLSFNVGTGAQNDVANLTTERMRISGLGAIKFNAALAESATVSATAAATTVTYDVLTNENVLYYTSNATANWTFNVRGSSGVTLNALMDIGQSLTVVFMNTNGTTAYYPTAFQIDGTAVTPKWFGGTAPAAGNASSIDVYTYNIIKTASATYTVLASQSRFA